MSETTPSETLPETTLSETLIICKPDAQERGLIGEILGRIERKGLKIVEMKMLTISRHLAQQHYGEHADKPFFGELVDFICRSPSVVAIVGAAGTDAVSIMRTLIGPTDPATAPPGTIRGDYGTVVTENLVHASDSPESASREIALFFPER